MKLYKYLARGKTKTHIIKTNSINLDTTFNKPNKYNKISKKQKQLVSAPGYFITHQSIKVFLNKIKLYIFCMYMYVHYINHTFHIPLITKKFMIIFHTYTVIMCHKLHLSVHGVQDKRINSTFIMYLT